MYCIKTKNLIIFFNVFSVVAPFCGEATLKFFIMKKDEADKAEYGRLQDERNSRQHMHPSG